MMSMIKVHKEKADIHKMYTKLQGYVVDYLQQHYFNAFKQSKQYKKKVIEVSLDWSDNDKFNPGVNK